MRTKTKLSKKTDYNDYSLHAFNCFCDCASQCGGVVGRDQMNVRLSSAAWFNQNRSLSDDFKK